MIYVVGTLSNGYCGCDESYFATYEDETTKATIQDDFEEAVYNYPFYEPDDRFCDCDDDEAVEEYQDDCFSNSYWNIVSKEEFSQACDDEGITYEID
jgi:hypothetical protein